MVIEATPFAKSSSNGDDGSGWSIKRQAYPENVLSPSCPFMSKGGEFCRNDDVTTCSLFWRRKITVISLNCQLFICYFVLFSFHKAVFTPPILICINPLVLFVRQTWNGNNALLVMKASFLLPSSPRVFCPLLSYSLSSVSLREFFGVVHLITCRTDYKLLQERSPAILSCHGKTRANSVLRMAYRIFPFFMRSFFVCPWFSFQHAFLWKRYPQIVVKPWFWCSTFVVNSAG